MLSSCMWTATSFRQEIGASRWCRLNKALLLNLVVLVLLVVSLTLVLFSNFKLKLRALWRCGLAGDRVTLQVVRLGDF